MNGTQRIHCIYSGMAKSTSQAEAMSKNNEKTEAVGLSYASLKASVGQSDY